jgi:hypothetical protein
MFRIAFYNVENLFDTIDDPMKDDASFLPSAQVAWTSERYWNKIDRIAEVIAGLSSPEVPALFGLAEIENDVVLTNLIHSDKISNFNYQIIHFESPDERGIDNALIYRPDKFRPLFQSAFPVDLSAFEDHTRDILYVKGIPLNSTKDTLHIFINHWPSRSEGKEQSEPKRIGAGKKLKSLTDSLLSINLATIIFVMGDFNDEPADTSVIDVLNARPLSDPIRPDQLYNLMYESYLAGKGTLYWKDWDLFDQIIVSGYLLSKRNGMVLYSREGQIFSPEWLMFKDKEGNLKPNRTAGKEYYGGYSDHLPVYIDLENK